MGWMTFNLPTLHARALKHKNYIEVFYYRATYFLACLAFLAKIPAPRHKLKNQKCPSSLRLCFTRVHQATGSGLFRPRDDSPAPCVSQKDCQKIGLPARWPGQTRELHG